MKQFTTSTVATSLTSSTEPIANAAFPKIVICNKYKLRCKKYLIDNITQCPWSREHQHHIIVHNDILFRQSFVDSLVASIKAYTGTNYTDEDISFAFYSHRISGWGMGNATHQVNISTRLHIIDKIVWLSFDFKLKKVWVALYFVVCPFACLSQSMLA